MKFVCVAVDAVHGCGKDYLMSKIEKRMKENDAKAYYLSEMWSPINGYIKHRKLHGQKEDTGQEVWWYMNWAIRECFTNILWENYQAGLYFQSPSIFDASPFINDTEFGYLFDNNILSFDGNDVIVFHNRSWVSVLAYSLSLLSDDVFNKWLRNRLLDVVNQTTFPKMEVVLHCTPEVGLQRLTKRSRPTGDDWNEYDMDYWVKVNNNILKLAKRYGMEIYDVTEPDSAEKVVDSIFKKANIDDI